MNLDEALREIERREEFLAYDKTRIAELEAQCAEFKRIGQQFERDSRTFFGQSCKNLDRAKKAERERDEYKTRLATASLLLRSTLSDGGQVARNAAHSVQGAEAMSRVDRSVPMTAEEVEAELAKALKERDELEAQCAAMREVLEQRGCEEGGGGCQVETPFNLCPTCEALTSDAGKALLERLEMAEEQLAGFVAQSRAANQLGGIERRMDKRARAQALEEAAKVAEDERRLYEPIEMQTGYFKKANEVAGRIAAAIRALKGKS